MRSQELTIALSSLSALFVVSIVDDSVAEDTQTLTVRVLNATIGRNEGTVTIEDED